MAASSGIGACGRIGRSRWMSPVLMLRLWEVGLRAGLIPERTLAAPSAVFGILIGTIASGELPANLIVSFGRVMLVIAEQINASSGRGYLVNMRTHVIVVCLMVYAMLGLSADYLVRRVEKRAPAWRSGLVEA